MLLTLLIRVQCIRNLEADFVRTLDKNEGVSVYADVFDERKEIISLSPTNGLKKGTDLYWSNGANTLSWTQPSQAFQDLKATKPTLKFHVATNTRSVAGEDCGFFLLDLRTLFSSSGSSVQVDLLQQRQGQEVKVNQLHGASILLSAAVLPQRQKEHEQDAVLRASASSLAASVTSVIHLPPHYDLEARPGSLRRYTLAVSISATRHLQQLLSGHEQPHTQSSPLPLWFSWSILDITIQSLEFNVSGGIRHFEASTDSLFFECSEVAMLNLLEELGSMRVFLCTNGVILGVAEIPLPSQINHLPLSNDGWFQLEPLTSAKQSGGVLGVEQPGLQLSFEVSPTELVNDGHRRSTESNADDKDRDNYSADNFDEDSFQNDEVADTMGDEDQRDNHHSSEGAISGGDSHPLLLLKGSKKDRKKVPEVPDSEEVGPQEFDQHEERKFRLCLQIRSLRPLHRPVRASIQFSYPPLGVGTAVRTHTAWTEANVETLVDGAIATYECNLTKQRLETIFEKDALLIQVLSRSHLGVTKFGDATFDLSRFRQQEPHSFICPITDKVFKSIYLYHQHRQMMIALHSIGKVDRVPPYSPITLKTVDTYLSVLQASPNTPKRVETVAKVRVFFTLEDFGSNSIDNSAPSSAFQSQIRGERTLVAHDRKYARESSEQQQYHKPATESTDILNFQRLEWERWRQSEEEKWSAALREKEHLLRKRLEEEAADSLSQRADDLKRAQEEVGRLEVRLRSSIDLVERQRSQLELKEEQMNARLAQKTSELELLQRRVREEAKAKIEAESRRAATLEAEVAMVTEQLSRTLKRAESAEKDFEIYKNHIRSMPETSLREETSRLKAQIGELRAEVERERRIRGEVELEKEHYRSQMHRIAIALKREREKSSAVARQELEQLRLEFLSREERYVLDGDRDELRTIRQELSSLRNLEASNMKYAFQNQNDPSGSLNNSAKKNVEKVQISSNNKYSSSSSQIEKINRLNELRCELLDSQLYAPSDQIILELDSAIKQVEVHMSEGKVFGGLAEDK